MVARGRCAPRPPNAGGSQPFPGIGDHVRQRLEVAGSPQHWGAGGGASEHGTVSPTRAPRPVAGLARPVSGVVSSRAEAVGAWRAGEVPMTPEEFRQVGHQLIDWIADYRAGVGELPVMSQVTPGAIRARLPAAPPQEGEPFATILEDVDRLILPGISHWQHPRFFAYFPGNASLASVLGDLLSSGLGVLGLSWQSSPALTELEETVTDWMRQLLGLSTEWSGVIQDSASTSTLVALLTARERATDHGQARGGLQAEARPLVVYSSAQSHSSVEKAALLAGFGRENVRAIATDERHALRVDALAQAIEQDLAAG